jgi:hypothetical protein
MPPEVREPLKGKWPALKSKIVLTNFPVKYITPQLVGREFTKMVPVHVLPHGNPILAKWAPHPRDIFSNICINK